MDHSFNIFTAAAQANVRRVVLASSNHVMGGYKNDPLGFQPRITPHSPPRVGTFTKSVDISGDAVAYGAAKLAAERLASTLGAAGMGTSFVVLRIGWCQPGVNLPSTLSAAGNPPQFLNSSEAETSNTSADDIRDEAWFKGMWLSNRDFLEYASAALTLDSAAVPGGCVIVNAMSNNKGMRWCLADTARVLGVVSQDDSSR